ncbi:PspC domain-containing protein [Trueperella pecoris]|uniref:PspC domain-containing protein n=2 Tax=Trueperella pecoris TaxID=2733571 RepID=A0A7M1QX16_9ACTO|nr:PspC domain-containing protein [Trueperella pecoris]
MNTYADLRAPWAVERPELVRRRPSVLAGVCRGMAQHLGGSVKAWRWGCVLLIWTFFVPLVYLILAMILPREGQDPTRARLVRPLSSGRADSSRATVSVLLAGLGVIVLMLMSGVAEALMVWVFPMTLVLVGAALAWSFHEGRWSNVALGAGLAIATMGSVIAVSNMGLRSATATVVLTGFASLLSAAFVIYPSRLRARLFAQEQQAQLIREETRADIAAHLHDSVLQTLALIRSRADDADAVRLLARRQEQELRDYLYSDRADEATSVAVALTSRARDLEVTYGAQIDVVITGDTEIDGTTQALIDAAGEAMTNACKHGGSPISVYAELGPGAEVWIRDRGEGFDVGAIGEDRQGIRQSIYGRMERAGGQATVRSPLPSGGTEVHVRAAQVDCSADVSEEA